MSMVTIEDAQAKLSEIFNLNILLIIFVFAGIALRLLWITMYPMEPLEANISDASYYVETACTMANNGEYAYEDRPTAYFPVGYPAYLSIFFRYFDSCTFKLAQFTNMLPSVLLLIGTYFLSLSFDRRMAKLTLFFTAISPNHIVWTGITFSETLFTALTVLATATYIHAFMNILAVDINNKKWGVGGGGWLALIFTGILGGAATLVRTQGLLLLPLFLLCLLLNFKSKTFLNRIKMIAWLFICWFLVIAPWSIRNHSVLGTWSLTTNGGVNFFIGAHQGATGGYHIPDSDTNTKNTDEVVNDKNYFAEGLKYIRNNPMDYISLFPRKLLRLWGPESTLTLRYDLQNKLSHFFSTIVIFAAQIYHIFLIMLIVISFWKQPKCFASPIPLIIIGVILTQSVTYILFFGGARYNYPMSPYLLILALIPWFCSNPLTSKDKSIGKY